MLELYAYPAGRGECLRIRYRGESGRIRNIIVDSGTGRFASSLEEMIRQIVSAEETLDALIVTHVDDDHLGGLLRSARRGVSIPAGTVYFDHMKGDSFVNGNRLLSKHQGMALGSLLKGQNVDLKQAVAGDIAQIDGAEMFFLGPTEERIQAAFSGRIANVPLRSGGDWGQDLKVLASQKIAYKDASATNGASITFVFAFGGKRLLFSADAWAEDILSGLESYRRQRGPICFDAVKMPHHGSVGNISEYWPQYIDCRDFIICADGSRHPDKQTVAKLIGWYGPITVHSPVDWWNRGFLTEMDREYIQQIGVKWNKAEGAVMAWK